MMVDTELAAALRSLRIQLIDAAIKSERTMKVKMKPRIPAKGDTETTIKLAITVPIAPKTSGKSCFGVAFQGFNGLGTII